MLTKGTAHGADLSDILTSAERLRPAAVAAPVPVLCFEACITAYRWGWKWVGARRKR